MVTLDEDIKEMNDFRYQTLVETFGKEEADKIMTKTDIADADELDDDIKEIVEFDASTQE